MLLLILIIAFAIFLIIRYGMKASAKAEAQRKAEEARLQRKKQAEEEQQRREAEAEARRKEWEEERAKRQKELEERLEREAAEDAAAEEAEAALIKSLPTAKILIAESPAEKLNISALNEISSSNITARTNREKLGNFVALDVETTGLRVQQAEIVDIAAVRFEDFEPVEVFSTLCFPKKGINPEAAAINGIHEDDVEGKPTFQQIAASLQDFIGKDNLVGHNLFFDLKFITKYGVDVTSQKRKYYDTLEISQRTVQKYKYKKTYDRKLDFYDSEWVGGDVENYKLGTLCEFYRIPTPSSHRALGDAIAAGRLFKKLSDARL